MSSYILASLLLFAEPDSFFKKVYESGCRFCWMYSKEVIKEAQPSPQEKAMKKDEKVELKKTGTGEDSVDPSTVVKAKERSYRILFFSAKWCVPCQAIKQRFDWMRGGGWKIGEDHFNHVQVIDSDKHPELISKYKISSLPTAVLINDGKEISRVVPNSAQALIALFNN